jgi:hypothetical protein
MADKSQIIDAIEALAVHCRPPIMSVPQRELWMRDWCADLASFPAEAITNACRKYRQSEATKFPTPGQLIPLVRLSLPSTTGEKVAEWAPLSDAEYASLSIRDKSRHRSILAHDARIKAGPMYVNRSPTLSGATPGHVSAENMPAVWRKWTGIAEAHEAEAKRLREHLRGRTDVAA